MRIERVDGGGAFSPRGEGGESVSLLSISMSLELPPKKCQDLAP